ncbi:glycine cleavage system aminomethyltransferase GcvT [Biformimicrobium ophioploci]|uniref:aminomethyltransferase n=1 Tax=Biformimicrobium ophioploci TaxID=3036711 RepID=A0ABQ6LZ90_9GAMM|nr:glycine cleavage system aminomethyltransferase GcvT [Microbulbifer sp. NKW57]GMG87416.1 glycine cleavage system aminomethyltransferase GcvT [Microbulbifer sp. NKW57]
METQQEQLLKTPLNRLHRELGAKLVPFAGYEMPVQYPAGVVREHLHTREAAGLFDVSHMGQIVISGTGVREALESLVPVDLGKLSDDQQTYAVFTNAEGGIEDDLIITRWSEEQYFLVVNGACKLQDLAHLQANLPDFSIEYLDGRGLLALQGPAARGVMQQLAPEAAALTFMNGVRVSIDGVSCYVTCSGYTGEDGFEISVAAEDAEAIARKLLDFTEVEPIGLGARDTLRLEAGLCLYGHDMDQATTPVEAGLLWSISKPRRTGGEKQGGFPGAQKILAQITDGTQMKRVGFVVQGRAPVREGAELVNASGQPIGRVTSGGFSPTLNVPIAMGYVEIDYIAPDTEVFALVRGKPRALKVARMPLVSQRYFRG